MSTCTLSALHTHTHMPACQMRSPAAQARTAHSITTPAQARSGSTAHACLPNERHARSSVSAQHACQMISAPVQILPRSTVHARQMNAPPLKWARVALRTCLPIDKRVSAVLRTRTQQIPKTRRALARTARTKRGTGDSSRADGSKILIKGLPEATCLGHVLETNLTTP